MSNSWDRVLAFSNGMVAGKSTLNQDGHKSSWCNPSRSSRSDFKPKAKKHHSTTASPTASLKLSKIKARSHSTKVTLPQSRHPNSPHRRGHPGIGPFRPLLKLQEGGGAVERQRHSRSPGVGRQDNRCLWCRTNRVTASGMTSITQCPIEHTRIRIQIQRGQADKVYSGSLDATVKIFKQYGIKGLNRGQAPTTVRESTGLCLYFSIIEYLTGKLTPAGVDKNNVPIYVPIVAGGVGGTSYWVFNYPFDYVKTLMQSDKLGDFKYKSMAQVFRDQLRVGGWQTFFKGYLICLMRSFPVNSAAITTYRFMQKVTGTGSNWWFVYQHIFMSLT